MGLLDQAMGAVSGKAGEQGAQNPMISAVLGLINKQSGGIAGLIQRLQKNGLGDQVASWIGKGQNLPVSGEQVETALGSEQVGQVAQQLNVSKEEASGTLAQVLPGIIDSLTPDGQLPDKDTMSGDAGNIASNLFSH
jgi:uncharacterized protein YidB (DUF937 family)